MRGKPSNLYNILTYYRITPAGAGKTIMALEFTNKPEDHPRRCGENALFHGYVGCISGSPPQVRGKPNNAHMVGMKARITPAGAGKTEIKGKAPCFARDHPRRCGENM